MPKKKTSPAVWLQNQSSDMRKAWKKWERDQEKLLTSFFVIVIVIASLGLGADLPRGAFFGEANVIFNSVMFLSILLAFAGLILTKKR
ncbi:MAG: hypothetical protein ISS36_04015 [Candidatus Aenigmarchaeota archaeon]|nr:hypothetical protein [Candidatus Aenigmarchaeota archaeon]